MAVDRKILQQALSGKTGANAFNSENSLLKDLQNSQDIQAMSMDSNNFGGGRAGATGLAAQLGTAAIGAYSRYKAEKTLEEKETAAQQAFAQKYPQFADLAGQLTPATREAYVVKDMLQQSGFGNENDPAQVREYKYVSQLPENERKAYIDLKRVDPFAAETGRQQAKFNYAGKIETEKALGKDFGEKTNLLNSSEEKYPELEKAVSELSDLGKGATYTVAGQGVDFLLRQTGMPTRQASIDRRAYISKIDNQILPLLRDTFGSQFTEKEGETLKNTLGNPDLSPAEKDVVLKSFIDQKKASIKSLRRELGKDPNIEKSRIINNGNSSDNKPSLDSIFNQ